MESLRQKVGQMFMVGCQAEQLTRDERLIFEDYGFGGFILFRENCREPDQISSLCRSLWDAAASAPPFIAIDQEGGRVHRLPPQFTHFPAAALIGATKNTDLAYRCGRATAAELRLVGINVNFAPVLDVNSNAANPIIGDRAFGAAADPVIEMSSAWMHGLRDGEIVPCGKHFPGHGDTEKDSHLALPVVDKSLDELRAVELRPFVQACADRLESLMTAHVVYRSLDADLPATLSERVVTGLLRHELGYDGVVFSDDMEIKAISDNFPSNQAAALAARAGVDVLLFCHDLSKAVEAFEWLCDEAEKDPALGARVENSYRRISELKGRYLKSFTGVAAGIGARLKELNHQAINDQVHGSL